MFNRLKSLIENPGGVPQPNSSPYNSLPNSMSPAAMPTPNAFRGAPATSGYNMGGNFRVGGVGSHRSMC